MDPPKVQKLRLPATSAPWALAPLARPGARAITVCCGPPMHAARSCASADGDVHPASAHWSGRAPSSRALPVGGAGISVQTAAVSSMRSSCENLWSASKSVVSPAGPPTANRAVRGTPASLLRLSCLAAPLRQGGKIRLSQPIIRRGTAESTAGCTSPSDSAQYLRMLVVGDIRARSYATGQQSLGDETTDVGATPH